MTAYEYILWAGDKDLSNVITGGTYCDGFAQDTMITILSLVQVGTRDSIVITVPSSIVK
jgi:hypothetical protein